MCGNVLASPFWERIEKETDIYRKKLLKILRIVYSSALLNGPFAVIVANSDTLVGLNDRLKLRPLIAACDRDFVYLSSEESAIRRVCGNPEKVWMPEAGEIVVVKITNRETNGETKKYQ